MDQSLFFTYIPFFLLFACVHSFHLLAHVFDLLIFGHASLKESHYKLNAAEQVIKRLFLEIVILVHCHANRYLITENSDRKF